MVWHFKFHYILGTAQFLKFSYCEMQDIDNEKHSRPLFPGLVLPSGQKSIFGSTGHHRPRTSPFCAYAPSPVLLPFLNASWKSCPVGVFSTFCDSASIISIVSKWQPFSFNFNRLKQKRVRAGGSRYSRSRRRTTVWPALTNSLWTIPLMYKWWACSLPVSPFSVSVSLDFSCMAHTFLTERLSNHCQGLRRTVSEILTIWRCSFVGSIHPSGQIYNSKRKDVTFSTATQLRDSQAMLCHLPLHHTTTAPQIAGPVPEIMDKILLIGVINRQSVGQSVLVSGSYLGPMTRFILSIWLLQVSWHGTLSDERMGLQLTLKLLLGLPRAVTLWSKSRRTRGYILLSRLRLLRPGGPGPRIYIPQEQGDPVIPPFTRFPFCRLLWLAGLR
jgi:hypothetical protein